MPPPFPSHPRSPTFPSVLRVLAVLMGACMPVPFLPQGWHRRAPSVNVPPYRMLSPQLGCASPPSLDLSLPLCAHVPIVHCGSVVLACAHCCSVHSQLHTQLLGSTQGQRGLKDPGSMVTAKGTFINQALWHKATGLGHTKGTSGCAIPRWWHARFERPMCWHRLWGIQGSRLLQAASILQPGSGTPRAAGTSCSPPPPSRALLLSLQVASWWQGSEHSTCARADTAG